MPLTDITTAIVEALEAIPAIGHVYPYERVAVEPTAISATLGPLAILRYWSVSRTTTMETWRGNRSVERLHRIRVRGHMALDDPAGSERVFQALVDAVLASLSELVDMPGSADYAGPPLLMQQEARLLAETVPVHWCEIALPVTEWLTVLPASGGDAAITDYRTLAEWITAQLGTIPNIGMVHPYERLTVEPTQAPLVFGDAQTIRAWTLTREAIGAERGPGLEQRRQSRRVLRGSLSVDDPQASELVLQALLEDVATVLRPAHTVGLLDRVGPLQIEQVEHASMGQTHLIHQATCSVRVGTFDLHATA